MLALVHPMKFTDNADSLLVKSYKPPISDSLRSGVITLLSQSKHLFKKQQFHHISESIFSNIDSSNSFLFLQRAENEAAPASMWIFDGDHFYYINSRESTITQYPFDEKRHKRIFNDYFFTKWLTKRIDSKTLTSDQVLKDTIINGIKRKYFSNEERDVPVGLGSSVDKLKQRDSIASTSRIDYYYLDSLSNIIRQEDYSLMMNDTQITISELKDVQPLSAVAARAMIFDTLYKYLNIYKNKAALESASKLQNVIPVDSKIGDKFPEWIVTLENSSTVNLSTLPFDFVLIDFSYASCLPCHMSISALNKIQHDYSDRKFSVIGMNPYDDLDQIQYTIKKDTILYPIYSIKRSTAEEFGITLYPTFLLLDKKRNIRTYIKGYSSDLYKKISEELDKLMQE